MVDGKMYGSSNQRIIDIKNGGIVMNNELFHYLLQTLHYIIPINQNK